MAYLSAADVKAASSTINDDDRFTDELVESLVAEFELIFEDAAPFAAEPRTVEGEEHTATRNGSIALHHTKIRTLDEVRVDGVAISAEALAALSLRKGAGVVTRIYAPHCAVVEFDYTHGLDAPDAVITRACVEYVRAAGLEFLSKKPRNTTGYTDDSGFSFRESTPDKQQRRWTGFIAVDRLINASIGSTLGFA